MKLKLKKSNKNIEFKYSNKLILINFDKAIGLMKSEKHDMFDLDESGRIYINKLHPGHDLVALSFEFLMARSYLELEFYEQDLKTRFPELDPEHIGDISEYPVEDRPSILMYQLIPIERLRREVEANYYGTAQPPLRPKKPSKINVFRV